VLEERTQDYKRKESESNRGKRARTKNREGLQYKRKEGKSIRGKRARV
jgi:hypothetical protein